MHRYYFENNNSCSYFSLCSFHNDFSNAFQSLSHAFISKFGSWCNNINQTQPVCVVDFKQGVQVNILSTVFVNYGRTIKK